MPGRAAAGKQYLAVMEMLSGMIVVRAEWSDNSREFLSIKPDQPRLWPMFLIKKLLSALILPPTGPVLLALLGFPLIGMHPGEGLDKSSLALSEYLGRLVNHLTGAS